MSNYNVTEKKLVITQKGKDSNKWSWLNMGGWSKGLKNPNVNRYASSETIEKYGLRASDRDLDLAVSQGLFEYKEVTHISSCM